MENFPSWKGIAAIVNNQKDHELANAANAEPGTSHADSQLVIDTGVQLQNLKSLSVKLDIEKSIKQYRENSYNHDESGNDIKINRQV